MRARILTSAALSVASLSLAACGSSTASSTTSASPTASVSAPITAKDVAATKAAVKASLLAGVANGSVAISLNAAGAQCVADAFVNKVGVARISQLGIATPTTGAIPMSTAEATFWATKLVDCSGSDHAINQLRDQLHRGLSSTGATTSQLTCMDQVVTRNAVIALLASFYDGQAAAGQARFGAAALAAKHSCGLKN